MLADIPLRELAELHGPERAFLSLYLSKPGEMLGLERRVAELRALLTDHPDEREHFDHNMALLEGALAEHTEGARCVFVCWALDHVASYPLPKGLPVPTLLELDSSPVIRPLAALVDDYEDVAVVIADNTEARVLLVSSGVAQDVELLKGNIKNHVRKGGWSQQRYSRRRDKQLQQYAAEIADALAGLDGEADFRRVLLLGSRETLAAIQQALSSELSRKEVHDKVIDLSKGAAHTQREVDALLRFAEAESERALWERIRGQLFRGGLAVAGVDAVLQALEQGRVDTIAVLRDHHAPGTRCRDCATLSAGSALDCAGCGGESVFSVDVIGELAEIALKTKAEVDFTDPLPELAAVGGVAALLRW